MTEVAETRFRAMGTEAHVIVVGAEAGLLDLAERHVAWLEDRWSRFRPASDVSLMNAMAGMPVRVEPETVLLVQRALDGCSVTDGRYDPTVLGAVVRAGYGRSYEQLADAAGEPSTDARLERGAARIVVDPAGGTITMPEGVGFDPGGIGKGLAADLVVVGLLAAGAAGACVNLGGDVRVDGASPDDAGWLVGLEHPFRDEPAAILSVRSGAVATTSRLTRVLANGHHVIDPATGAPARTGTGVGNRGRRRGVAGRDPRQGRVPGGARRRSPAARRAAGNAVVGHDRDAHRRRGRGPSGGRPRSLRGPSRGERRMNWTWYAARAGGFVAWGLAAASVALGLALSGKVFRRPRPAWTMDMHRFLGGLAVIFTIVHVAAVMMDQYVSFGLRQVFVPLASSWHPVAVAWGVIAMYMLLAVELTSLARRRIPRRLWRQIHLGSFVLFGTSTVHALTAGTDTAAGIGMIGVIFLSVGVIAMVARRIAGPSPQPAPARPPARVDVAHPVEQLA